MSNCNFFLLDALDITIFYIHFIQNDIGGTTIDRVYNTKYGLRKMITVVNWSQNHLVRKISRALSGGIVAKSKAQSKV